MSEYLTPRQAASVFGVKTRTVRDWIARKILAAKRDKVTGQVYIPKEEIERRKADLEDWQPSLKPITITGAQPDGDAATRDETTEDEAMPKGEKQEKAQEQTQGAGQQGQRAPPAKKSSWGTVLDDDEEE